MSESFNVIWKSLIYLEEDFMDYWQIVEVVSWNMRQILQSPSLIADKS